MALITWDQIGARTYELGVDRGVLYLPGIGAVPWNGLKNVTEKLDQSINPVFFDGTRVNDIPVTGTYSATIKAITYPDEFLEFEGHAQITDGAFFGAQRAKPFALSYRTLNGNDTEGIDYGYKLHVIVNLTAIPSDKAFETMSVNNNIVDFSWNITASAETIPGFGNVSHMVFDSTKVPPALLTDIEEVLYGTVSVDPTFSNLSQLHLLLRQYYPLDVSYNDDPTNVEMLLVGTTPNGLISIDADTFSINNPNAWFIARETYQVEDFS
jgi:hypothetical protein